MSRAVVHVDNVGWVLLPLTSSLLLQGEQHLYKCPVQVLDRIPLFQFQPLPVRTPEARFSMAREGSTVTSLFQVSQRQVGLSPAVFVHVMPPLTTHTHTHRAASCTLFH